MDGIFISYRRDDSAGYAGRLYDRLSAHFGADQVFMDVAGIELGTDFVTAIEARFGRSKDPRYGLAYTITTEAVGVGFATDTTITRYNLTGRVEWSLTDTESDTRIAGGTAENFTSWSATSATVAAVAAEQDAAKRLMVILADQIAAEILAASVRFTP